MKARPVRKLDPEGPMVDNAARIVRVRLDELRSFAERAVDRSEEKAQHNMRIAAKRLRYALEVAGFCFGLPADRARRRARGLQDVLGEMHDCDVMLPRVLEHLGELREADALEVRKRAGDAEDLEPALAAEAPGRTNYRGLEVLAVHLRARRHLLHDRFRAYWAELEQEGVWEKLSEHLDAHRRRVKAERRAGKEARRAALEVAERDGARRDGEGDEAALALPGGQRVRRGHRPTPPRPADPGPVGKPGQGPS